VAGAPATVTGGVSGLEIPMPIELKAHTDAGARLVAIAEELSGQFAGRAAKHDRDGTYPFEAIDALRAAGYFAAPIPIELGGLGVSSAHDLVVASSRLARGDASVAIGVNMHLVAVLNMVRRHQVALASGAERRARAFGASLEQIVRDGVVLAAAISERGQDLTRPGTVATRIGSGWRIDGQKMFCTMSPAATDLYATVTYADRDGIDRYAYAMVPTDAPGVVVHDDWDALGMRASGSNSVSFEGVELPESGVRGGFRAGDPLPYMERNLHSGLFHAAASLGIAESADAIAREGLARRINGDARPRMRRAGRFAVNVLSADHERFAARATDPKANRFAGLNWGPGAAGAPVLADALACLECRIVAEYPAGDHWIVVARVESLRVLPGDDPLIFFAGNFARLSPARRRTRRHRATILSQWSAMCSAARSRPAGPTRSPASTATVAAAPVPETSGVTRSAPSSAGSSSSISGASGTT
jgi:alkylation response protein AidB-like acyl-CoA dehydrogenase